MDILKDLFPSDGTPMTYDQLATAIAEKKLNIVDLSTGGYVSRGKHEDNLRTLNEQIVQLQEQITQRDTDLASLRTSLEAAQADAGKLADAQQQLTNLQTQYATDKEKHEQQIARQRYEFAIRERANGLDFSSTAAKRAFIQEAIAKDFKQDGETLLGYEEFVAKYRTDDPGAFKAATATPKEGEGGDGSEDKPVPQVVLPTGTGDGGKGANPFKFSFHGVRPE